MTYDNDYFYEESLYEYEQDELDEDYDEDYDRELEVELESLWRE